MNAREKKGAAPANDKTSFEVTVLMPSRPEDFAVLVDKTNHGIRKAWLEATMAENNLLKRVDVLGELRLAPADLVNPFFAFIDICLEDKKHPEVGVLALEYATSVAFSHQFRGVKSNSSVYVPQGTRPKRDKWNADEVTGEVISILRAIVGDSSAPLILRSEAILRSTLLCLCYPEMVEGGIGSHFRELLSIVTSAAATMNSESLTPPEEWLAPKEDDEVCGSNDKVAFLAAVLQSFNALLYSQANELQESADSLFGNLESLILSLENSESIVAAVSCLVSLFDLLFLLDNSKEAEDVTLIVERLESLANADLKSHKLTTANRERWSKLLSILQDAADGKAISVEIPTIKFSLIDRNSVVQRIASPDIRAKTENLVVPWALSAPLQFIHDVFGPDFNEFVRKEFNGLHYRYFGIIQEFDAWANASVERWQDNAWHGRRKTYVDDISWKDGPKTRSHRKHDAVAKSKDGCYYYLRDFIQADSWDD